MIEVPENLAHLRPFPLDGALLLFDRDSGWNIHCEGVETEALRQRAPRVVQFAITNACNLTCSFCSRDVEAESTWTPESAFEFLAELSEQGVLEVAFGGGEPWAFRSFDSLLRRLYDETALCVNVTTNGFALTESRLTAIAGCYGQIRLSLYEDNDWRQRVSLLVRTGARFGINYLVTPDRVESLDSTLIELVSLGCRDVILLSYVGADDALHLDFEQTRQLERSVEILSKALRGRCVLKLDVCWGDRLGTVPRLFEPGDCGAGREFIVVTSDKQVMPCSFHDAAIPVRTGAEAVEVWRDRRDEMEVAASARGCARSCGKGCPP